MAEHFKQTENYGCGLYAIANIFQDESFITQTRLIESKEGNHIGQLNKWLLEYKQNLYLQPLFFNNQGKKIPKWVRKIRPNGENVFSLPVLIDIQYTKNSKTHFVAGEILTTGDLILIDSSRNDVYFTTLDDLNKDNYRVYGVWYLRDYDNPDGYFMRFNTN